VHVYSVNSCIDRTRRVILQNGRNSDFPLESCLCLVPGYKNPRLSPKENNEGIFAFRAEKIVFFYFRTERPENDCIIF